MIIQSARNGEPYFVVCQVDHARLSGQFAAAFGNDTFAPLEPKTLMEFVTAHHDEGWAELDAAPPLDPGTNLPYQFFETPRPLVVPVHAHSPEYNERHHPFCGLLASMHTWGLYHGRYGLAERATIDSISPADKPAVLAMLQTELARQARLQNQLAADQATRLGRRRPAVQLLPAIAILRHAIAIFMHGRSGHAAPGRVQARAAGGGH